MANLGLKEIFGNAVTTTIDPVSSQYKVNIDLRNFVNNDDDYHTIGQIADSLGLSSLDSTVSFMQEDTPNATSQAYKILYAVLLLIKQNQAVNINADIEQKIFVAEQFPRLGVGSRTGQIQRSFLVSFFTEANIASLADIDDL